MKKEKTMLNLIKGDKIEHYLGGVYTFIRYEDNQRRVFVDGVTNSCEVGYFHPYEEEESITKEEMPETGRGAENPIPHLKGKLHLIRYLIEADKHYKSYQAELLDDNDKMNAYIITQKIKVLLESL